MQLTQITPRFLYDASGNKAEVVLKLADFERLLETIEDLQDVRDFNEAKAEPDEFIDLEELRRRVFGA